MKRRVLIIIFFLLVIAGRAAGQCTLEGSSGEADQTVCEGNAITDIKYSFPGATEVTSCDLPDGLSYSFTAPVITITGTPTASGEYSVTLSDGTNSCTSSGDITVSQKPVATAGGTSTICVSGFIIVSGASYSNGTVSWTSDGKGTLTGEDTESPTYTPDEEDAGNIVTLTMTVTNASCDVATATYTVNVIAEPNASAGGISEICGTGSVTISGASSTIGTILWTSDGAGTISDEATLTPKYTAAADDIGKEVILTMTVTNAPCSDATAYHTIHVRPIPTASAGGVSTICETETVTVSGASYSNGTILWTTTGGGILTNENTITPTYDPAPSDVGRTVILTLTVSNSYCESATASYTIIVHPAPTLSSVSQSSPLCAGNTADINLTGLVPANSRINYTLGSDSYSVDQTITTTTTTFTTSRPPVDGENLQITLISIEATGCSTSFVENITMDVNPMPVLTDISLANPVCIGENATINLEGLLTGVSHTVIYEINTSPVTNGSVTISSGATSFELGPLNANHNGKTVTVTRIETGDGCSLSLPGGKKAILIVNTPLPPVITGDMNNVCVGASKLYQVEPSMTNYSWIAENGTIAGSPPYGNTVNIIWNSAGSQTLSVSYTNTFGCTASSSYEVNVSALPVPGITGPDNVCQGSTSNVYTANPGMTSYSWNITGGTWTPGESGNMIYVTWNTSGSVELTGINSAGCSATQNYPVNVKARPVVTITDGPQYPRVTSSDNEYVTQASMTDYEWSLSGGGTGTASGSTYTVTWHETGVHKVFVNYKSSGCKALVPAERIVDIKPLPSVSDVHIDYVDGDPKIGGRLEVDYTYTDGSTGSDMCTYKWYRGTELISVAKVYTATAADFGRIISCEVTPVSSLGSLSGTPVTGFSDPIENLDHPEVVPVADQVCIEGLRAEGSKLTGKYRYSYPYKSEGISTYRWIRRDSSYAEPDLVLGTDIEYTLTSEDLKSGIEIYFEVTPVSSNYRPIAGIAKKSKPLAKIMGLDDRYGISEPPVTLASNVPGGYFSGPGIYGNIFMPDSAGEGTWEINYFRFYEYSSHTCSQRSPREVKVDRVDAVFSPINSRYCFTDPVFVVTVSNVPEEAINQTFSLTDPSGVIGSTATSVTIDPGKMSAGNHTLNYSYNIDVPIYLPPLLIKYLRLYFRIDKSFIIDKVSNEIKLLGIADSYCENDDQKYVTVENVYPLGGTGHWTGSLLVSPQDVVSAYLDPELGTAGNTYNITYRYESPLGCFSPLLTKTVAINPLPSPAFSLDPIYNIEGPEELIIPETSGGVFKGKGISGNMFLPSVAGEGTHIITYTIRDGNNCVDSLKRTTEVRSAKGTISGIADVICYDNINLNLNMTGLPSEGILNYIGFSNTKRTLSTIPGTTSAVYSVPAAGEGHDTIYFSYEWDNVDYSISRIVNIDSLGTTEIYNLKQDQIICDDVPPFELTVSKPGGTFTGPVVGGYFDPSKAKTSDVVKYTFINPKTLCSIDTSYSVKVYRAPGVDFIPYDVCIVDDNDTIKFMNKTTSSDPVVKWEWMFYDEGRIIPDSVKDAKYLYLKGGLRKVSLKATTDKGCFVEREKTFDIARRPVADFYWTKDCYHPGESLRLIDAAIYNAPPKSWSWKINGVEIGTSNDASVLKTDTGYLRIEYIVRTDYADCHDTIFKDIYIRPSITVGSDGYFEDFETGKGGWITGDTSSIWSFGLPAGTKIKSAASGQHAWFTANARDGSSAIESPCFDLSYMSRPSITLKLSKDMDKDRDGVALQYRIGDDGYWNPVGTIDDGIEWYNSATISGKPGGNPLGWTTVGAADEGYKNVSHTLDELKGKKDVRFRMVYGSSGAHSYRDGVAFDDIFIGERSRRVLVEHFTSYNSSESMNYKALVDTIAEHRKGDVINIQYHTNFSGIDSLYVHNPGEINARIMFYGLTRVPYTFVDGGNNTSFNKLYDYRSNPIDSNEITKRTLVNSRFDLYIEPVVAGRALTINGYIKALEDVSTNNLTLFIAVTEKRNKGGFEGVAQNTEFLNVFRKFIPDAAGTVLKNNWIAGESISVPEKTWTIDKALNSSDIEIIAFLQNADTKEVYQAFSVVKPKILVGIENPVDRHMEFSLYPNPASTKVTIGFAGPLKSDALIKIFNIQGEVIREYMAGKGSTEFRIEDPGLKSGIYLVRISVGLYDLGYKKLIVTK